MLTRHVSRLLSAYHQGELDPATACRVEAHLRHCSRCRQEDAAIRSAAALVRNLPLVTAPEPLWDGIEARLQAHSAHIPHRHEMSPPSQRGVSRGGDGDGAPSFLAVGAGGFGYFHFRRSRMAPRFASALLIIALLIAVATLSRSHHSRPAVDNRAFWRVAHVEGAPSVGPNRIISTGR